MYHETIRRKVSEATPEETIKQYGGVPLNQEDLLGMQLTFSISVFEVLEQYGVSWTAEEQQAYLHLWDVIGAYLGIGTSDVVAEITPLLAERNYSIDGWIGLRPPSIKDTRALLDQIRHRQWAMGETTTAISYTVGPVGPSSLSDGRLLASALLDELACAMPPMLKLLPATMMRALAPEVVRRRLSLGGNGAVLRALQLLPGRRNIVDRFTSVSTPNPVTGRVLRAMANEVSTRATVRFLGSEGFTIPGHEQWSHGFNRCI
jgi:hypothetical protein